MAGRPAWLREWCVAVARTNDRITDADLALRIQAEGRRILRDDHSRVLRGAMNLSARVDDPDVGAVLYREPIPDAQTGPFEFMWSEPVIKLAMQGIAETPRLLYATPGWERSAGHFQIHEFALDTAPMPPYGPLPDHVAFHDIPVFCGELARLRGLPEPFHPPARNARDDASLTVARHVDSWRTTRARCGQLLRDLGIPDDDEAYVGRVSESLAAVTDVPVVPLCPDLWRGNMLLHREGRTVFVDPELLTIGDPRKVVGYVLSANGFSARQQDALVARMRTEMAIPDHGFRAAVDAWRDLQTLTVAMRWPYRKSLELEDRLELGHAVDDLAEGIAMGAAGNAEGIGRSLALAGRTGPSADRVAWAYRRELDRQQQLLQDSGRLGSPQRRAPTATHGVRDPRATATASVRAYAFGERTERPPLNGDSGRPRRTRRSPDSASVPLPWGRTTGAQHDTGKSYGKDRGRN